MELTLKNLKKALEQKSSLGSSQILSGKEHSFNVKDKESYAKEGYGANPTVYSCITLIGKSFSRIPLKVKNEAGEVIPDSPLQALLDRPNLNQGGVEFRNAAISWYMLTGTTFTERTLVNGVPAELYHWKPYQMSITGERIPSMYYFRKGMNGTKSWSVNQIDGDSDMNHWSTFNPNPDESFIGQSPLQAGAVPVDTYNSGMLWRYNSLMNGNVIDGILSPKGNTTLDAKQTASILTKLTEKFRGAKKAGNKLAVVGTEMAYTPVTSNARDSEFINGTKLAKSEIAETLGVPGQLIGIEGSTTYANYKEANKAFFYQTIIPLLDLYVDDLNRWIGEFYPNQTICFDLEDIPALESDRAERRKQKVESKAYSINEIRQEFGDEPRDEPEADFVMTNPSEIPLGMDVFMPEEKPAQELAKSMMKIGVPRAEAEQKALDIFHGL